jgi:hypothetical protein
MIITSLKNKFHFKKFLNKFNFEATKTTVLNIVAFSLMMPLYYTISEDFVYNNNLLLNIPLFILFCEAIYCCFIYRKTKQKTAIFGFLFSIIIIINKLFQNEIITNKTICDCFYILFLPILFFIFSIIAFKMIINNKLQEKLDFIKNIKSFPAIEIILLIIVVLFKLFNHNYLFIYFFDEYLYILIYLFFVKIYNFLFLFDYK